MNTDYSWVPIVAINVLVAIIILIGILIKHASKKGFLGKRPDVVLSVCIHCLIQLIGGWMNAVPTGFWGHAFETIEFAFISLLANGVLIFLTISVLFILRYMRLRFRAPSTNMDNAWPDGELFYDLINILSISQVVLWCNGNHRMLFDLLDSCFRSDLSISRPLSGF